MQMSADVLQLDHLLVAASDLVVGCDFLEDRLGQRPLPGGSHPGQGTRNAILPLDNAVYMEVIAPDPAQAETAFSAFLSTITDPALLWWALRSSALDHIASRLKQQGIGVARRAAGQRELPAGAGTLGWELLIPEGGRFGNHMPFFIHWRDMKLHPSVSADAAGEVLRLEVPADFPVHGGGFTISGIDCDLPAGASFCAVIRGRNGECRLAFPASVQPPVSDLAV